ncbi:protein glass-like [Vespa crabro]|uniref:protein glass-like n=1 Tax=Vespa crabro TaxID=7445 RepID=UPI001F00E5FE|nr:protein glass-like [Vespa crabro]
MAENQMAESVSCTGNALPDKEQQTTSRKHPKDCSNNLEKVVQESSVNLDNNTNLQGNCGNVNVRSGDSSGYSCLRCGNAYTRPHSLNRHIRFECGVEPQFECPICHKKSKHKHNLLLHMRTHQKP